jgi:hypothetical protein
MDLWAPTTTYFRGRRIIPATSNGWRYRALIPAGSKAASAVDEPTWKTGRGTVTPDASGLSWLCEGFEPYTTDADFKAKISEKVVSKLVDDNRDGFADTTPLDRLHIDGSVHVNRWAIRIFRAQMPFARPFDEMLTSFALDAMVAYGAQRHPRVIPGNAKELFARLNEQLELAFKEGEEELEAPNPARGLIFDPNPVRTIIDGEDGTYNGGDL